jgi:hypothetical protein
LVFFSRALIFVQLANCLVISLLRVLRIISTCNLFEFLLFSARSPALFHTHLDIQKIIFLPFIFMNYFMIAVNFSWLEIREEKNWGYVGRSCVLCKTYKFSSWFSFKFYFLKPKIILKFFEFFLNFWNNFYAKKKNYSTLDLICSVKKREKKFDSN